MSSAVRSRLASHSTKYFNFGSCWSEWLSVDALLHAIHWQAKRISKNGLISFRVNRKWGENHLVDTISSWKIKIMQLNVWLIVPFLRNVRQRMEAPYHTHTMYTLRSNAPHFSSPFHFIAWKCALRRQINHFELYIFFNVVGWRRPLHSMATLRFVIISLLCWTIRC